MAAEAEREKCRKLYRRPGHPGRTLHSRRAMGRRTPGANPLWRRTHRAARPVVVASSTPLRVVTMGLR